MTERDITRGGGEKPSLGKSCHACQSIPAHGYCRLSGCPMEPGHNLGGDEGPSSDRSEPKPYEGNRATVVVPDREAITHDLKTWPVAFAAVSEGLKPWEYRKADRDYRVGDFLLLREWSEVRGYTGETLVRKVTWMLPGGMFGIPEGYCVMSLSAAPPSVVGRPDRQRVRDDLAYLLANERGHAQATIIESAIAYLDAPSVVGASEPVADKWAELAEAAKAATPGDLDTVPNPPSEYGGHSTSDSYECPACGGEGEVEGETYCNFDGMALGVQFFGIGNAHKNYERFFRLARPATVLDLIQAATAQPLEAENRSLREALELVRAAIFPLLKQGEDRIWRPVSKSVDAIDKALSRFPKQESDK